jgi:hypothetical protein
MTMHAENIPTVPASPLATLPFRQVGYTVTVTPDGLGGAAFEYRGDQGPVPESFEIDVPPNEIVEIRFSLDESSGELVSNPINWYSNQLLLGGSPIDRPAMMAIEREEGSKSVTILNDNTLPGSSGRHHFTLTVLLDKKVYTSPDPTIINNPIGSVDSGRTLGQDLGKGGVGA